MKKYFLIVGDPVGSEYGTRIVETIAEARTWQEATIKANRLWKEWEENYNQLQDKYNLIAIEEYEIKKENSQGDILEKEYIRSHCQLKNGEWD